MIVAFCASMDLALAVSNLVGMLMAGLGGALGSVESFPDWARTISRISPAYWAMDAVRRISLQGAGIGAVGLQLAVLAGFGAAFLAVALARFRVDDSKTGDG
jgi:ABC-2 type transport system permease protein